MNAAAHMMNPVVLASLGSDRARSILVSLDGGSYQPIAGVPAEIMTELTTKGLVHVNVKTGLMRASSRAFNAEANSEYAASVALIEWL